MRKAETFTIEKDFGDKTLENVFVKQSEEQDSKRISLQEILNLAKNFVCVVAENTFSDELMDLLCKTREKTGIRIYALVRNLEESVFERLKNNCIVRTVPHINGNYLICDRDAAFFFDTHLQGYALQNAETVGKLHDTFIYEFWNNAENEFVTEKKKVLERTFDVSPVPGNKQMIINRSALSEKPYNSILQKATDFAIVNHEPISEIIELSNAQHIYLNRKSCEKNREYLLTEKDLKEEIIYSDDCRIPLCKSGEKWYISNSSFDTSSDNDGKLFFVEMENEPKFSNAYHLEHTYTYRDAVGKEMLALKDFSSVTISDKAEEQKSFDCDYKTFKNIKKMSESERDAEFSHRKLLASEKLSASVTFQVTITVSTKSNDAKTASIYAAYANFRKQKDNKIRETKELVEKYANRITSIEEKIKKNKDDISKIEKNISEYEKKRKEIVERLQNEKTGALEKVKSDAAQEKMQIQALKKQDEMQNNLASKKKEHEKMQSDLESKKREKEITGEKLSKINALEKAPKTVADCKKIADIFESLKSLIPPFDEPCFGTLYEVKDGYEYALRSDEDYDKAEEEMHRENVINAGIKPIKFVAETER